MSFAIYQLLNLFFLLCGARYLGAWAARQPGWLSWAALTGVMGLIALRWAVSP